MIRKIQVLNYRVLHQVSQNIEPFQVLVGANASGKSTFMDVINLMADLVRVRDFREAINERSPNFSNLCWRGQSDWFELALEVQLPETLPYRNPDYPYMRYEVRIGYNNDGELALLQETLWLIKNLSSDKLPSAERITVGYHHKKIPKGWRKIVNKTASGSDYFRQENSDWNNNFRLGPWRSALGNLPEDETRFPAAIWFKNYLLEGIQRIALNSEAMRMPSPPNAPRIFQPDGSNLPHVIHHLATHDPDAFEAWVKHIRTALPDVQNIITTERPEDKSRYLSIEYSLGASSLTATDNEESILRVPSWAASDGTLRLLALTILAYLPETGRFYLVEEPENGIHPLGIETIIKSFESMYENGIMVATHSPLILNMLAPQQLLCFTRQDDGSVRIVRGDQHPNLRDWQGKTTLDILFAAGVLG